MTAKTTIYTKCRKPRMRAAALGSTFLVTLLATQVQADDFVWDPTGLGGSSGSTGGADNTWAGTNWYDVNLATSGQNFGSGESAIFRAPPGETVVLGFPEFVTDVTFETGGYQISDGGAALVVFGDIIVTTAGDDAQIDADLVLNANIGGAGNLTLTGDVGGAVNNSGGGMVTVLGEIESFNNTNGDTEIGSGATVTNISNPTNTITGGEVAITGGTVDGSISVTNAGMLDITTGTITGAVTNAGDFDVNGGTVGDIDNLATGDTAITGPTAVTGAITNAGTLTQSDGTVASLTNTGGTATISGGAITADLDVSGGIVIASGSTIGGNVGLTAGTLSMSSAVTGDVTIGPLGGFLLSSGGSVGGTLTNASTFIFSGGTVGDVDNSGILGLSGDQTVGGTLNNSGTLDATTFAGNQTLTTTGTFTTSGDITTDGPNTLTITSPLIDVLTGANFNGVGELDGTVILNGAVTSAAALDVTGPYTLRGTFDNSGILTVSDTLDTGGFALTNTITGQLITASTGTITGAVTNAGDFDINGGMIGSIDNVASGDIDVTGTGTVIGPLTSLGSVDIGAGGTLTVGGLTSINDGDLNIDGTFLGDLTIGSAGALTSSGGSVLGSGGHTFANNGSSNFNLLGTVNGNVVANGGTSLIGGSVSQSLTANSGAIVNILDGASAGTVVQNNGTFSLVDSNPTTDFNIAGDAVFNGILALDVDLSNNSTAGDTINVGGNVSGSAVLSFNSVGESDIDDIPLITYGGSNTLTFSSLQGLPQFGEFEYFLSDSGAGTLSLQSRVNSGIASLASSIGVTQTIVGAVINRPTSPYVADLATDYGDLPCGGGAWARPTYGQADASGTFDDLNSGTTGETPIDLIYRGIQIGGDFACFDDRYNGFDMAFGVIGGYNDGDTTALSPTLNVNTGVADGPVGSVTTTDFNQTFAGVYMTASRDRFFADLQMRYEVINFESTNKELIPGAGFDLDKSKYDTTGGTISGAVGYAVPVESVEGMNVIGSIGFSYSEFETDEIDLGEDGSVQLEDSKIKLGFLSGTVARTKLLPDEVSLISYFGTATVYNDFADEPVANYIDSTNTANPLRLSKLGTYGEISAGVNYVRLLSSGGDGKPRQLNAAGRLDYRKGGDLESWGITAQIRYQF